jgi:hypothetical protein
MLGFGRKNAAAADKAVGWKQTADFSAALFTMTL